MTNTGGGHQGGHFAQGGESGHHVLSVGDLSNDNMTGTDYQYFNVTNFIDGLRINMGIRFAILFIAFAGWLYVVYWIRHHEPLANQVIGINTPTANQDRSIIAAMKNSYALKTTSDLASPYVPESPPIDKSVEFTYPSITNNNFVPAPEEFSYKRQDRMPVGPGQAMSSPIVSPDLNFDQRFGLPVYAHETIVSR
jgi:hypothetical protein